MPIVGALVGALIYESCVGIHQDNAGVDGAMLEKAIDIDEMSESSYSLEKESA